MKFIKLIFRELSYCFMCHQLTPTGAAGECRNCGTKKL